MRVRLGIEHCSSNGSRSNADSSSDSNNNDTPERDDSVNKEHSLLVTVGEVVVSGGDVEEFSSSVHLEQSSVKVLRGSVELHAVLRILFGLVGVVVVLGQQLFLGQAVGLSQISKEDSGFEGIEHGADFARSFSQVGVIHRVRGSKALDLDNVGSIGLVSSFSGISSGVGVTSGPLEVDKVSNSDVEIIGNKVVFSGRVGLDDVSSFSSDVQVEDTANTNIGRSRDDGEDVRSVLEGSEELRGINGHLDLSSSSSSNGLNGISLDGGGSGVAGVVNEASVGIVSISIRSSQVSSGDVVSQSQHTLAAVRTVRAVASLELGNGGEGPVVLLVVSCFFRGRRSQVVISGEEGRNAIGRGKTESIGLGPLFRLNAAVNFVVFFGLLSGSGVKAKVLGSDVLGFSLVKVAELLVLGQNGNISPGGWVPVRIVVSFFGTFVSMSIGIVVLSGEDGGSSVLV